MRFFYFLGMSLFLFSCSELELSKKERLQREKAKGEFIERGDKDVFYPYTTPKLQKRAPYKWEEERESSIKGS